MSMHFRELAETPALAEEMPVDAVIALCREGWADGTIGEDEANGLFEINEHLRGSGPEWTAFFVEAIVQHLATADAPRGYVSEDKAQWLIDWIDRDQHLDSMVELELLEHLFEQAVAVPPRLQAFALAQIEAAVLSGEGPTRDGGALEPGTINAAECRLLRRFVFAPAGDRPAAAGKSEAEMLFRIKDASLGAANAPEWQELFVQGVASYLQGFGGNEPISAERAGELESFMAGTAASIGAFLSRMMHADPAEGAAALAAPQGDYLQKFNEAADDAAELTDDEQQWLKQMTDADGELDPLEQALLDFLAA